MCGIVGYVGEKNAVAIIVEGLKRLEYRGYDSAGLAVLQEGKLEVRRAAGRIKTLEGILRERPVQGALGIGHTRWATHGRPSDENAHPHTDCGGTLVVVHNGILENYLEIKDRLLADGHQFRSETDTEVLAHLIEHHLRATGRLDRAVKAAALELTGSYAIGVVSAAAPDRLVAAKHGAGSVVIGLGQGEMFVASDIPAILSHTRDVVILEDDEVAVVTAQGVELSTLRDEPVQRDPVRILWDPIMAEKGGYRHFMLKEIHEQPRAITDTFRGRIAPETGSIVLPDVNLDPDTVRALQRVVLVACGTASHAALDRVIARIRSGALGDTEPYTLGRAVYLKERWTEARAVFDPLAHARPENVDYLGFLGATYARLGEHERAAAVDSQLARVNQRDIRGLNTRWRAQIAALLGDRELAMRLLRQAADDGIPLGIELHADIDFETLLDYPPFQAFIKPKG